MSVKGMLSVSFDPPQLEFLPDESCPSAASTILRADPEMIRSMLVDLGLFGTCQAWPGDDCLFRISVSLSNQQLHKLKSTARAAAQVAAGRFLQSARQTAARRPEVYHPNESEGPIEVQSSVNGAFDNVLRQVPGA